MTFTANSKSLSHKSFFFSSTFVLLLFIIILQTFIFLLLSFVFLSGKLPPRQSHPPMCPTRPYILCLRQFQITSEMPVLICFVNYRSIRHSSAIFYFCLVPPLQPSPLLNLPTGQILYARPCLLSFLYIPVETERCNSNLLSSLFHNGSRSEGFTFKR